ncbi:protein-glutamate methylesterase/protein-glutamine glutaminase [Brevundimonas goettingensis]|nr:chemotaxis response regulator protein-glutamate methylesterase [Brevundimonas goettingensis]
MQPSRLSDIAQPDPERAIRVMVVDDSAVVRGLIARALEADVAVTVVARAGNGQAALAQLEHVEVDVIVLDLEMPVMDGMTALPLILARRPGVRVIVASTLTFRNARLCLDTLQAGASDYVSKPESGGLVNAEAFHQQLLAKVRALGGAPEPGGGAPTPDPAPRPSPRPVPPPSARTTRPEIIVIGGSTGAPPALVQVFEALRGLTLPILLTQHMPPMFTALLAEQLSRAGDRPCREAVDGEPVVPGRAYVAPGGWHMTVERAASGPVIRLDHEPPEHFCRPAVDPLMRSVARTYGASALAVILTGMGSDGASGCAAIAEAGGRFVVQDEATSVVWGMPGAAARTGRVEAILPLSRIGEWLRRAAA